MLYANLYQSGESQFLGNGYATRKQADTAAEQTNAQRIMVVRIVNRPNVPVTIREPQPVWLWG